MTDTQVIAVTHVRRSGAETRPAADAPTVDAISIRGSGLHARVVKRNQWAALVPAWDDLVGRCAEDNVYYSPKYSLALAETTERRSNVSLATVWDGNRLVALLPFVTKGRLAFPFSARGQAWASKFVYNCMPLFDRDRLNDAAEALVELLCHVERTEWIIPTVNVRGAACQALLAALEKRARPWFFSERFERAVLNAGLTFEEHEKRYLSANRRKSLARNRRRLSELGSIDFQCHVGGSDLDSAVSAFLEIEGAGWKGRRGTALAKNDDTKAFALKAFTGSPAICRADVLNLNGNPIAVSLVAKAGQTGFAVKAAYDENYRSYSPGLLLELELIRSFLSGAWARQLDGATAGEHVLDEMWSDKTEVADLIFSLNSRLPRTRLLALQVSNRARSSLKNRAKVALALVRS